MDDRADQQYSGPQGSSAYQRLLGEIRDGSLPPGARLRETELAERLGVSRTPVREAIRQLETDGLVTHVPRHGATVRTLDYAEVMELYEMRGVLEGTAARLAARAAAEVELDELIALNDRMAAVESGPEAAELNRLFHATLLDAAKNRFLARSIATLQKGLLILGPTTLADQNRAAEAAAEHAAVLEAMQQRDGEAAEQAMRAHIRASQRLRIGALRDSRDMAEDG
ncbi:GntR family transcriptional regulator [Paracoccus zeaxanthinifaciens]|uniref:GntR family transcriptional regulator n=1 Tax=Paracoccus zeaxanthinifaciens TaxID=187400 RepID=UPI0003B45BAB|nr:GntR family transcriptional regulator [Paracoccus zeaxanthinifaciens]